MNRENKPLDQEKKLSHSISRENKSDNSWMNDYIYKFRCHQYLESIDDVSRFTSFTHDEYKQHVIDALVNEFRHSLNHLIFSNNN